MRDLQPHEQSRSQVLTFDGLLHSLIEYAGPDPYACTMLSVDCETLTESEGDILVTASWGHRYGGAGAGESSVQFHCRRGRGTNLVVPGNSVGVRAQLPPDLAPIAATGVVKMTCTCAPAYGGPRGVAEYLTLVDLPVGATSAWLRVPQWARRVQIGAIPRPNAGLIVEMASTIGGGAVRQAWASDGEILLSSTEQYVRLVNGMGVALSARLCFTIEL